MTHHIFIRCMAVAGLLFVSGCGPRSDGPPRYPIRGTVTANGQPVREGRIFFSPDTEKGNAGPGAMAFIRDGAYETPKNHGIVGGPHIVDILGWDELVDPASDDEPEVTVKKVFPVDLPKDGGTYDFTL